jgi:glutathione S-transferase
MHSSFNALRDECPMDIRGHHVVAPSAAAQGDIRRIGAIWTQALQMSGAGARWLYGGFSVADAMFAPVVFRLNSLGIEVSPLIQSYIDFVLADEILAEWVSAAHQEAAHIEI